MCEQFAAFSPRPFRIDHLWPFTERLERYGVAGFGWGAAWLGPDGRLAVHRDVRAFRDDPGREVVGANETSALLVHLRRPSRLSTIGPSDTQPFEDPAGRFAFSHNGELRDVRPWRTRFKADGRIHGRADSEVGERWLEDTWGSEAPVDRLLASLHETFGGQANLGLLTASGIPYLYAGNLENPVFAFRLGDIAIASTAIYSLDRSLFTFVAPEATRRRLVPQGTTVCLAAMDVARAPATRTTSVR